MSKSKRSTKLNHYEIDETELIEFVKHHPPMYTNCNSETDSYIAGNLWEELATKLNAPVELVKEKWMNIKDSHTRRKSLRSVHNLSFLTLLDASNDNSCASSNCSSPKEDGKRSLRSLSQLSTASETEGTISTVASNSVTRSKQTNTKPRSRMSTSSQKDTNSVNETQSMESNARRFQEISSIDEDPRPVLTDSFFLTSKEGRQNDMPTPLRRLSDALNGKNEVKKQNTADSTRAFFESMAMTVSTFPQHIQATLKVRICNLVGDAEYGLTIPKQR